MPGLTAIVDTLVAEVTPFLASLPLCLLPCSPNEHLPAPYPVEVRRTVGVRRTDLVWV